jgi:hypothetical protein
MRQVLAFPHDLPGTLAEATDSAGPAVREISAICRAGRRDHTAVLDALRTLPLRPPNAKLDRWEWHSRSRRSGQFAILDQFFGVSRATAATAELFAHAAAVAYRAMLDDALRSGTGLSDAQWSQLCGGLESIIQFCAADPVIPAAGRPAGPAPRSDRPGDPHLRWRTGHQVFFPLVQATLVGLRCFVSAVLAGAPDDAATALGFASGVMGASARALEFAADFTPESYAAGVRPSMTPPGTKIGLSGLMSADHHEMVVHFQQLRPIRAVLAGELSLVYDRFVDEVSETYRAHRHVCTRFNGDRMVSLRMNDASATTAAGVLEQLAVARVRMLRPA